MDFTTSHFFAIEQNNLTKASSDIALFTSNYNSTTIGVIDIVNSHFLSKIVYIICPISRSHDFSSKGIIYSFLTSGIFLLALQRFFQLTFFV